MGSTRQEWLSSEAQQGPVEAVVGLSASPPPHLWAFSAPRRPTGPQRPPRDLNASLLTAAWAAASTAVFDANRLTRVWWLAYIVAHCLAVP